jgi:hypothetical protein
MNKPLTATDKFGRIYWRDHGFEKCPLCGSKELKMLEGVLLCDFCCQTPEYFEGDWEKRFLDKAVKE